MFVSRSVSDAEVAVDHRIGPGARLGIRIADPGPPPRQPRLTVKPIVHGLGHITRHRLDRAGGVEGF